jgi:hypothetical protein
MLQTMFIFLFLIPLQFFNFALVYAISKIQEYQAGLKLNGTNQLVHADDVNLLRDNIYTIKKNTQNFDASKEVGLEVNAEKTKCLLLFHYQNAGQNHGIKRTVPLKMLHSSNIWEL